jgi:hypothetical protein
MNHDAYTNAYISGILNEVRSIAIVGASANDVRPSFFVAKYLLDKGYRVFPVNPGQAGKEILGRMTLCRACRSARTGRHGRHFPRFQRRSGDHRRDSRHGSAAEGRLDAA